jgi:hypothetical protein
MNTDALKDVLTHPSDNSFVILTYAKDEGHLVSSWNSYLMWDGDDLIVPVGGMHQAEENLKINPQVKCILANKDMMGAHYKGVGFSIYGTGTIQKSGPAFERMKEKFGWARAILRINITSLKQILGA